MMTHHSPMVSSLRVKKRQIFKFGDFSSDIDYNIKTDVFRDIIYIIINHCEPRRQRAPPAETKCPPAAHRMQAKRACLF